MQGEQVGALFLMVQDHGPAGEKQGCIRNRTCLRRAAAGFALQLISEVAQPAESERARVLRGQSNRPATPHAVQPAEEGTDDPGCDRAARDQGGPAGVLRSLAEAPAVVGQDREAVPAVRVLRGGTVKPCGGGGPGV